MRPMMIRFMLSSVNISPSPSTRAARALFRTHHQNNARATTTHGSALPACLLRVSALFQVPDTAELPSIGSMEPTLRAVVYSTRGRNGAPTHARRVSAVASSHLACPCPRRRTLRQQPAQTVVRLAQKPKGLLLLGGGRTRDRIRHARDEILGAGQRHVARSPGRRSQIGRE